MSAGTLAGQFAVGRPRVDVEVDVAGAVLRDVRVAALDQERDQLVHLGDVAGRPGLIGRGQHTQRVVDADERALVRVRDRPERRPGLDRLRQHLVIDVGDVADEGDLVAAVQQPAPQHVVVDAGAQVTDVRPGLDGEATQVDTGFSGHAGDEVPNRSGRGVIDA